MPSLVPPRIIAAGDTPAPDKGKPDSEPPKMAAASEPEASLKSTRDTMLSKAKSHFQFATITFRAGVWEKAYQNYQKFLQILVELEQGCDGDEAIVKQVGLMGSIAMCAAKTHRKAVAEILFALHIVHLCECREVFPALGFCWRSLDEEAQLMIRAFLAPRFHPGANEETEADAVKDVEMPMLTKPVRRELITSLRAAATSGNLKEDPKLAPNVATSLVNWAAIYIDDSLIDPEFAHDLCALAREIDPTVDEAVMQLANILRILGRRKEAIDLVWGSIFCSEEMQQAEAPLPIDVSERQSGFCSHSEGRKKVCFVSVLWGKTVYNEDYVNILNSSIRRNLSEKYRDSVELFCVTDRAAPGDERASRLTDCKLLPLPHSKRHTWWGKASLFSLPELQSFDQVIFLDLDQVIVGNIDWLVEYDGPFMTLSTEPLLCELAVGKGYNSSVLVWKPGAFTEAEKSALSIVNSPVSDGDSGESDDDALFTRVNRYCHRFDHWLEMSVQNADLVQDRCGAERVKDYWSVREQKSDADFGCETSIITFPRTPKPHEVRDKHGWINRNWKI